MPRIRHRFVLSAPGSYDATRESLIRRRDSAMTQAEVNAQVRLEEDLTFQAEHEGIISHSAGMEYQSDLLRWSSYRMREIQERDAYDAMRYNDIWGMPLSQLETVGVSSIRRNTRDTMLQSWAAQAERIAETQYESMQRNRRVTRPPTFTVGYGVPELGTVNGFSFIESPAGALPGTQNSTTPSNSFTQQGTEMSAIKFRKPNAQERNTFCGATEITARTFVSSPGTDISINELVIVRVTSGGDVKELFTGVVTAANDDATYDVLPLQATGTFYGTSDIPSGWASVYITHRSLARNTILNSNLDQWLEAHKDGRVAPDNPSVHTGVFVATLPREAVHKVKVNDFSNDLMRCINTMRKLRYSSKPGARVFLKLARLAPGNVIKTRNRDMAMSGMTYANIQYGRKERMKQAETVSRMLSALNKGDLPIWSGSGKTILDYMEAGKSSATAYREMSRSVPYIDQALHVVHRKKAEYVDLGAAHCGHIAKSDDMVSVLVSNGDELRICKHCADKAFTETVHRHDTPIRVEPNYITENNVRVYDHGDDLVHITPPQALVRNYHSSKSKFTALPLLDGTQHFGVQVGIELEVQCTPKFADKYGTEEFDEDDDDDDDDNDSGYRSHQSREEDNAQNVAARMLHNAFTAAMKDVCGKHKRYAFYEYDGSVDYGFEVITNYGPMETHRHIIATAMGPNADGKYPYAKVLRSHDASSSCGLHVHLTKPRSLMHASRIFAFVNSAQNKDLIECVARRYSSNYAAIKNETTKGHINKAGRVAKNCKTYIGNIEPETVKTRFNQLHDESRYSAINYNNSHTVEFRIFKGSMLPTTILACVEFAYMVWMFARDTSMEKLNEAEFITYIKRPENLKESAYLRAYLIARGRMPAPKVKPGERKQPAPAAVTGET